jgi:hypothetical protein
MNIEKKFDLSKEEQSHIIGGATAPGDNDVHNDNRVSGCVCTYVNKSAIKNTNAIGTCECICIKSSALADSTNSSALTNNIDSLK